MLWFCHQSMLTNQKLTCIRVFYHISPRNCRNCTNNTMFLFDPILTLFQIWKFEFCSTIFRHITVFKWGVSDRIPTIQVCVSNHSILILFVHYSKEIFKSQIYFWKTSPPNPLVVRCLPEIHHYNFISHQIYIIYPQDSPFWTLFRPFSPKHQKSFKNHTKFPLPLLYPF